MEIELKIMLDAESDARLRRHPALVAMREGAARTENLVSVYYDAPDARLAVAGIALRLRKAGRRWVQTVKKGPGSGQAGLFSNVEIDRPAPGGRLNLDHGDPEGVYAEIVRLLDGTVPQAAFETRVRRTAQKLRAPGGGLVELALDRGEIVAGPLSTPIREAEFELVEGDVTALYETARTLIDRGPVRFSLVNKAARGWRLATEGVADLPIVPRKAGDVSFEGTATVETVARDVFRDCFAQIAANMVVVAESSAIEGPHQLRVGLRRLRTAFSVFGPTLGRAALAGLSDEARRIGQVVSPLRDLDVLAEEVLAEAAALGLDAPARDALSVALAQRRAAAREEVRSALAAPEAVRFLFDLGRMIEGRGWLEPADYSQTERLAAPIADVASGVLDKRLSKARKLGRGIRHHSAEELHALRKELKKLRYAADMLAPVYSGKKVVTYLNVLRNLQDTFGSLNDAAMAEDLLLGTEGPTLQEPAAQRAVGWVLGTLAVKVGDDHPQLFKRWEKLAKAEPFWA